MLAPPKITISASQKKTTGYRHVRFHQRSSSATPGATNRMSGTPTASAYRSDAESGSAPQNPIRHKLKNSNSMSTSRHSGRRHRRRTWHNPKSTNGRKK